MNYYKIPPYLVIFMVLLLSNYMGQIQNFGKILAAGIHQQMNASGDPS